MREEGKGGKREKWLCDSEGAAAEMLGAGLAGGKSAGKLPAAEIRQAKWQDKQSKTKGSDGAGGSEESSTDWHVGPRSIGPIC